MAMDDRTFTRNALLMLVIIGIITNGGSGVNVVPSEVTHHT
jgi:hypothetical protein